MAVKRYPQGNRRDIKFVDAWRPARMPGVLLWAEDPATRVPYRLVQWGDGLYLPVDSGSRISIRVYNGTDKWLAVPTYVEAACLYEGGPAQPNDCTSDHMWEVYPGQAWHMDAFHNPATQQGRPLVIVDHGQGFGIGEARFGTDEFRGQIRVYGRTEDTYIPAKPYDYPDNEVTYRGASPADLLGGYTPKGGGTRGATRGMGPSIRREQQVGIGLGATEHRGSHDTGKQYHRDATLLAAFQIESRHDLAEVIREAHINLDSWLWHPSGGQWWQSWVQSGAGSVARDVPVAPKPHRPEGCNWGLGF